MFSSTTPPSTPCNDPRGPFGASLRCIHGTKPMDQKELRELEKRCIQEEPPWCAAACPLHVDARSFAGCMSRGDWEGARKVLEKAMPFPGVFGRVCDHPCQEKCKRGEAGDPVAIGALERACVQAVSSQAPVRALPSRGRSVAVMGGGPAALVVAWDLARKGYGVEMRVRRNELGGTLRDFPANLLPPEVVREETDVLLQLGVEVHAGCSLDGALLEELRGRRDAVFIEVEDDIGEGWGLERDEKGGILADERTRATSLPGVFAGGGSRESVILAAARGRWAATSMDRHLQGVSPTAGREKEGPCETRLFTSLEGVDALPVVSPADPAQGYGREEAMEEAARCLQCQCLECVKICPYLERFGGYPKRYAREIYNNESIVMGERKGNLLVNSCSLCRLCEEVCPENFSMADLCHAARESMVSRGKMPPSAHEFALRDMAFSNGEKCALFRSQPGHPSSAYLFFPGCQLSASAPHRVERVYEGLCSSLEGGVGLALGCCGAPARWAARNDLLHEALEAFKGRWEAMGKPKILVACPSCYQVFKEKLPQAPATFLWEVLETTLEPLEAAQPLRQVALHDPCAARHEPDLLDTVRRLLQRRGFDVEELKTGGVLTECCGYGGLMANANPPVARAVVERRAGETSRGFVTYCAMCRDRLARAGKPALHLLDALLEGVDTEEAAGRKPPGYSQRRENRARLKRSLLKTLWGEEEDVAVEEHESVVVRMEPDLEELLEDRRILAEDLRHVIHEAEKRGRKLVHRETGRFLAAFKPAAVTYWVEYSPSEDGFTVHNAYSHRMEVLERGPR